MANERSPVVTGYRKVSLAGWEDCGKTTNGRQEVSNAETKKLVGSKTVGGTKR